VGEQRRNGGNNFKPYPMTHGSLISFLSGGLAHRTPRTQWQGHASASYSASSRPPQTVASWHDKPTCSKSRAEHRKLYDGKVSEYGAATASAPIEAPGGHATPVGDMQAGQVAEGRENWGIGANSSGKTRQPFM
jgi:hypothetical protein